MISINGEIKTQTDCRLIVDTFVPEITVNTHREKGRERSHHKFNIPPFPWEKMQFQNLPRSESYIPNRMESKHHLLIASVNRCLAVVSLRYKVWIVWQQWIIAHVRTHTRNLSNNDRTSNSPIPNQNIRFSKQKFDFFFSLCKSETNPMTGLRCLVQDNMFEHKRARTSMSFVHTKNGLSIVLFGAMKVAAMTRKYQFVTLQKCTCRDLNDWLADLS